ncbi:MAG: SoxR reducing system RseC family protein [Leptospirales bacterium]|nr:SoxR reducing system RseC family protein [Leptospirales bacterium]
MRTERGIVTDDAGGKVLVEFLESDRGCSSCSSSKSCPFSAGRDRNSIWLDNTIGAKKGDFVNFIIEEKHVVMASALVYLVPTVLLIGGAILGNAAASVWALNKDVFTGIGGITGLLISVVIIKTVSPVFNKKKRIFQPVLVRSDDFLKLS